MTHSFRWGIIAPGRIAHRFAQALEAVEGAKLQAVASRDAERARTFAMQYGAPAAYDSAEALALDPEVDAVYIASPHRFHHEQSRLFLLSGKPVLVEKPFTVNAPEAADLIDVAQAKGLFLMEALWSRYLPVWLQVREWLEQGAIGDVHLITSMFCFHPERDPADRKFNHDLAGGALLDLGVYNVSLSEWVSREPASEVFAVGQIGDTGVDELTSVTLRYPSGAVAQFTCGFQFEGINEFTAYGTDGAIRVQPKFWESTRVTLFSEGRETTANFPFRRNGFEYQIEEAMACVRDGRREREVTPLRSTLSTMKTIDRIREQIGLAYTFERTGPLASAGPLHDRRRSPPAG